MSLITEAQLDTLRSVAYRGLETPITIKRPTQVEGPYGSEATYATVTETLGWIREMSTSRAGEIVSFIGTTGTFRLHVRHDVDLRPGDRVELEGDAFEVADVNDHNTLRIFTTGVLRRVE